MFILLSSIFTYYPKIYIYIYYIDGILFSKEIILCDEDDKLLQVEEGDEQKKIQFWEFLTNWNFN